MFLVLWLVVVYDGVTCLGMEEEGGVTYLGMEKEGVCSCLLQYEGLSFWREETRC